MPKGCRICRVPWTEDEDNILQEYYPKEGGLVCHRLPGRTRNACKNRAQYIRLQRQEEHKFSRWTEEEDAILKEYYPTERETVHLRLPGRTASACQRRAVGMKLGLQDPSITSWTEEEDQIMREYYPKEGGRVQMRLTKRTKGACKTRAKVLGLRFLKDEI